MKKFILTIGVFVMFGMINTVVAQQPTNEPASTIQKKHKANCKNKCCAKANTKQTSTGVVKTKCKSSCSKKCCSQSDSKSAPSGATKAKCSSSCKSKCCANASKSSGNKEK